MATEERVNALEDKLKAAEARVSAVSVKLPPFWPDKVKLWFAQAEAQFVIRNITVEQTRYAHVVSMLDSKSAEFAMDIIENPPPDEPYTTLKKRLTGAFAISDDEKAAKLLEMDGLGDKTPSQCLSAMLMLVPDGQEPGFLFRKIFLRQMPEEVQTHLAQTSKVGTKATDLRELALEADKFFASTGSRITSIMEASPVNASSTGTTNNRTRTTGRSRTPPGSVTGSHFTSCKADCPTLPGFCKYHAHFGVKARSCVQPYKAGSATCPENLHPGRR